MLYLFLVLSFSLLLAFGVALALVPFFPAFWYLIALASLFGAIDGFAHLTLAEFSVLAVLFLLSLVVDWSAGLLGGTLGGAAWRSIFVGALGGAVGFLILPPFGAVLGAFGGVLLGELYRRRRPSAALKAAGGVLLGSLSGVAVNVFLAIVFVALFLWFALP